MPKGMGNLRVPPVAARRALGILERILRQPTSPFHEHRVRGRIQAELDRIGIPWRLDAAGNLLARTDLRKSAVADRFQVDLERLLCGAQSRAFFIRHQSVHRQSCLEELVIPLLHSCPISPSLGSLKNNQAESLGTRA